MRPLRNLGETRRAVLRAVIACLVFGAVFPAAAQMLRPLPAPMSPAGQAPAPPDLTSAPRPPRPPVLPRLALPDAIVVLPSLGWRVSGPVARGQADPASSDGLALIGRHLATTTGRVTVLAQAAGPADDPSLARRASLDRAIALKGLLVAAGLDATRVDIRAMGRTPEARDALDILAPPAPPPPRPVSPAQSVIPQPAPEPTPVVTPAPAPSRATTARGGPAPRAGDGPRPAAQRAPPPGTRQN